MSAQAPYEIRFCAPIVLSRWVLPLNLSFPPDAGLSREITPEEARFLQGEAVDDEAERALERLVDRAAAAPNGVFVACEVPDDA